jgi:hypothetical protein
MPLLGGGKTLWTLVLSQRTISLRPSGIFADKRNQEKALTGLATRAETRAVALPPQGLRPQ